MLIAEGLATGVAALVFRWRTGAWTHPAVIFAIFWLFMTVAPLVAVPDAPASPMALGYLIAAVVAFGLPALGMHWRGAIDAATARGLRRRPEWLGSRLLVTIFIACELGVLAMIIGNLNSQGFSPAAVVADPIGTGCRYLGLRYGGGLQSNVFSQVATLLNYIGAPLAGLLLVSRKNWGAQFVILASALLPSLIFMVLYADKGTLFLTGAYLFGGVIVARVAAGNLHLVTRRMVAAGFAIVLLSVPALGLAFMNRITAGDCQDTGRSTSVIENLASSGSKPTLREGTPTGGVNFYLRSYAFGHLFAFSDWFDAYTSGRPGYRNPPQATWGFWTFMAVGHLIDRSYILPPGYFDEYFTVKGVVKTNIYTMFRGLIYDFGVGGSLLFMILFGWISSMAYRNMLLQERVPIAQAYFVLLMGIIYTSYIISLLIWNSSWAFPIVLVGTLMAVQRLSTKGHSNANQV